ncbi:NADH-quinone oxidoreductase subunit N [Fulvivirgaceae bacterium PWU4]|uniref:NADH-quinone oxidoreductase subunit N n=1 Tax=Chryseosolibacter histidini TaxID=2782349 RepID=A0AAP2GHN0_9BACT|nr:NADH-quinone oxidoreductase subunit N [Chryseosolibacter histidini]MBT1696234.1 NADH-quinone oxidoreductase subunit N [Chryseosolibacter histidini]
MAQQWNNQLNDIAGSLSWFIPELILALFLLLLIALALFKTNRTVLLTCCMAGFILSGVGVMATGLSTQATLFGGMTRVDGLASYLKILIDLAGFITCLMSFEKPSTHRAEYFALLMAVVLGGHLLVASTHFLMIFLSLELISLSSYVLAGYSFTKAGSEGSLKYFLFGSVASAVMLYGFSFLYGITGTLDFSSQVFFDQLIAKDVPMVLFAALMVLAGFLYKIAAAPMHPWAPDVYEASPIPVMAFLSVAPKLAGLGVLLKFVLAMNLFGQSSADWQAIVCAVLLLTITIGNFSALRQQNPKRLMAYSSIAQSGFLLVGVAAFLPQGVHFMLFYASVYLIMNFAVFVYLDFFEKKSITSIAGFSGAGKNLTWPSIGLLVGLIALTGLPPTAGFTAKLFIFSALWQSYELSGRALLLWVVVIGLLNTVVSLFYYLRIPYFAFLKSGEPAEKQNNITFQNLLGFILVLLLLTLFFIPGILMGWINKINFVL